MSLTRDLKERVKGLSLEKVDFILVKEQHLYDRLVRMEVPGLERHIVVMRVNEFDDLKSFSEEQMKEAGWVRA